MSMFTDDGWTHCDFGGMMVSYPPGYFSDEAVAQRRAESEAEERAWRDEMARKRRRHNLVFWTWMVGWFCYLVVHVLFYNGLL